MESADFVVIGAGIAGASVAYELADRGTASLMGGLLLVVLLRDFIPVFTGIVLAGKIGATITSEIGSVSQRCLNIFFFDVLAADDRLVSLTRCEVVDNR